ncbi:MAG: hypothetical protein IPH09_13515 [bacterium]|nr:hypothetical protein [bacterium]
MRAARRVALAIAVSLSTSCACPRTTPAGDGDASGEVQASNLLLWQVGRDPRTEASASTGSFDQFDLVYGRAGLRAGLRAASYRPSRDDGFLPARYDEITLKFAEWEDEGLRLRLGDGFATLGRGLLFRAFELGGVVRDAVFPASQYTDSRSLEGVILEADRGPLSALLFGGEPVRYADVPPGIDALPRREGHVSGGHASIAFHPALAVGAGYLRSESRPAGSPPEFAEFVSADLTLRAASLSPSLAERGFDLQAYAEYAGQSWDPLHDGLETGGAVPHAFYTATQISVGRWGGSYETKDYDGFALGWNDPPNLVPEMSQHLLNRRSHFLLAGGEHGRQISAMGSLPGDMTLQFDSARAVNEVGGLKRYRLDAVALQGDPLARVSWELFAAVGRDEVEGLTDHRTAGVALSRSVGRELGLRLVTEYQRAERTTFGEASAFENLFLALGLDRAGLGTVALQAEFSNDPDEKDDPLTFGVVEDEPRRWFSLVANAPLYRHHEATLFAGSRRGGTACTSGTCYLVPDFTGVELRLVSRY